MPVSFDGEHHVGEVSRVWWGVFLKAQCVFQVLRGGGNAWSQAVQKQQSPLANSVSWGN